MKRLFKAQQSRCMCRVFVLDKCVTEEWGLFFQMTFISNLGTTVYVSSKVNYKKLLVTPID